ncbi:CDCA5 isoform 5, partial [Pan troglodytes]
SGRRTRSGGAAQRSGPHLLLSLCGGPSGNQALNSRASSLKSGRRHPVWLQSESPSS